MPPNDKLGAALEELRHLQKGGARVFSSGELSRVARERLLKNGFLTEVMKGWLLSTDPSARPGDTTPWFASFWEFCRRYCEDRFGRAWHLPAEQSLLLHAEDSVIPKQLVIHSPTANNARSDLAFETSLFALRVKAMPPTRDLEVRDGLPLFTLEAALVRVTEEFFLRHPIEAQVALQRIREPSGLLARLLEGGHSVIAGRLAGAFRHVGQDELASEIAATMSAADHVVREKNPFDVGAVLITPGAEPIVARLQALWATSREAVISEFPPAPGVPEDSGAYLESVDDVYKLDAYHSLSIEGYQVSTQLIERVMSGSWAPEKDTSDREDSNALAARGYWLAFQRVREAVVHLIGRESTVAVVRDAHREWYRHLFTPHVQAALLKPAMLAGYRSQPVFLRGSRHVPPRWGVLRDAMPALFDLIENEPEPCVRAVLGHWLFGYVHPFPDGNGRIARFVMNTMLASGGYPWTIVRVEDRDDYLDALEVASVNGDVRPFARFIAHQMRIKRRTRATP